MNNRHSALWHLRREVLPFITRVLIPAVLICGAVAGSIYALTTLGPKHDYADSLNLVEARIDAADYLQKIDKNAATQLVFLSWKEGNLLAREAYQFTYQDNQTKQPLCIFVWNTTDDNGNKWPHETIGRCDA